MEDIAKIKKRADEIISAHNEQHLLFKRYRDIFFMDNVDRPKNSSVDRGDWKLTASPSGRNEVIGMKRLMDTSEIGIEIKENGAKIASSDRIEEGLKKILRVSGELKRARIEKDANLSAVLYGPVVLRAESVDDLIATATKPVYRRRLEQFRKRSPFLISVVNAEESFADWGKYGMLCHVEKYNLKGSELQEAFGVDDVQDSLTYELYDYIDPAYRCVWVAGRDPIIAGEHNLPDMNVFVRYAGGSNIFEKPEEQLQSFLYGKAKGELDYRENLILTYIFTAIYQQGLPGRTYLFEGVEGTQPTIDIDFASGIKKIVVQNAKAQPVNMPVLDNDIIQVKSMLDEMSEASTIRGQTLGENIGQTTFSALSMLSNAGKLPLVDSTEAVSLVFTDAFSHILYRIRDEGIENDLIEPSSIPETFEVIITMEAKLPQDNLRNAQIATALGDKVSDEWIRQTLLQISDSREMDRQIAVEQLAKAMQQRIATDPAVLDNYLKPLLGQPQQPPTPPQQPPPGGQMSPDITGQMSPEQMPPGMQPGMEGITPEQAALMAQGGMEAAPKTDSMIPQEERR